MQAPTLAVNADKKEDQGTNSLIQYSVRWDLVL